MKFLLKNDMAKQNNIRKNQKKFKGLKEVVCVKILEKRRKFEAEEKIKDILKQEFEKKKKSCRE